MPEEKEPVKNTKEVKPKKNKLWWFLGGGCCLILLILFVLSGLLPFLSLFHSSADTKIPTPNLSSSATSKTALPTAKTTQSQNYPVASQCEHLELVDSIPVTIDTNNPGLKQNVKTHYYQVYGYTPYEVSNAEAGLAENWQRYMTNLIIHEEGHKDLAISGAQAILDALLSLPNAASCGEDVQSLVSSTGDEIFADYNARQKAYDTETNHGETQGAYFP